MFPAQLKDGTVYQADLFEFIEESEDPVEALTNVLQRLILTLPREQQQFVLKGLSPALEITQ